jgi:hypothetical protein
MKMPGTPWPTNPAERKGGCGDKLLRIKAIRVDGDSIHRILSYCLLLKER